MTLNFSIQYLYDMEFKDLKDFTEEFPEFMTDLNNDEIINTLKTPSIGRY